MDLSLFKSQNEASKQFLIAFTAILWWDWLAMLPSEVRSFWRARWTYMKTAYMLKRVFWIEPLGLIYVVFITDVILAIRVWAIYDRNRKMGFALCTLLFIDLSLMIGAGTQIRPTLLPAELRDLLDFHGCIAGNYTEGQKGMVLVLSSVPLAMSTILLLLTLYRSYRLSKDCGGIKIPLLQKIVSSGTQVYAVILVSNLINVYFYAQSNPTIKAFGVPCCVVLSSVLSCRLALALFEPANPRPVTSWNDDRPGESSSLGQRITRSFRLRRDAVVRADDGARTRTGSGSGQRGTATRSGASVVPSLVVHLERNESDGSVKTEGKVGQVVVEDVSSRGEAGEARWSSMRDDERERRVSGDPSQNV
ncbi:hypothetical protein JCM10212_005443 [Sporobolomyces blumeae]